jgi:hypothetical protein
MTDEEVLWEVHQVTAPANFPGAVEVLPIQHRRTWFAGVDESHQALGDWAVGFSRSVRPRSSPRSALR